MASSTFQSPTSPANASQAQQEAGSSTSVYVSPGVQQYHPSASKAWVNFNGQGTVAIRTSYNVTSITDSGTGTYVVNFTTAFSSADYTGNVNISMNYGTSNVHSPSINTGTGGSAEVAPTASAFSIYCATSNTSAAFDPKYVNCIFAGDQ